MALRAALICLALVVLAWAAAARADASRGPGRVERGKKGQASATVCADGDFLFLDCGENFVDVQKVAFAAGDAGCKGGKSPAGGGDGGGDGDGEDESEDADEDSEEDESAEDDEEGDDEEESWDDEEERRRIRRLRSRYAGRLWLRRMWGGPRSPNAGRRLTRRKAAAKSKATAPGPAPECAVSADEMTLITDRVKAACQARQSCGADIFELVSSAAACTGQQAALKVDYRCAPSKPAPHVGLFLTTICGDKKASVTCPSNKISVLRATWGRYPGSANLCGGQPKAPGPLCGTDKNALVELQKRCQGKTKCTVTATPKLAADGEPETCTVNDADEEPYLRVWYQCVAKPPKPMTAEEIAAQLKAKAEPPKLIGELAGYRPNPDVPGAGLVEGWACLTGSSSPVVVAVQAAPYGKGSEMATGVTAVANTDPAVLAKCGGIAAATVRFSIVVPAEKVTGVIGKALKAFAFPPGADPASKAGQAQQVELVTKDAKPVTVTPPQFAGDLESFDLDTDAGTVRIGGWACGDGSPLALKDLSLVAMTTQAGAGAKPVKFSAKAGSSGSSKPDPLRQQACGAAKGKQKSPGQFVLTATVDGELEGMYLGVMAAKGQRIAPGYEMRVEGLASEEEDGDEEEEEVGDDEDSSEDDDSDGKDAGGKGAGSGGKDQDKDGATCGDASPPRPSKFCSKQWFEIFDANSLLNGFKLSGAAPAQSIGSKFALLVPPNPKEFPKPQYKVLSTAEASTQITHSERETAMATSGFVDVSVSASYGFVSASASYKEERSSESSSSSEQTRAVASWNYRRLVITWDPNNPSPFKVNPDFVAAVQAVDKSAAAPDAKFGQYQDLLKSTWGHVIPSEVELGAKLYSSFDASSMAGSSSSSLSQSISAEVSVSLGKAGVSVGAGGGSSSSSSGSFKSAVSGSTWTAVGGATSQLSGGFRPDGDTSSFVAWAASVDQTYDQWRVIKMDAFVPAHRLLPADLKKKVEEWQAAYVAKHPAAPPMGFKEWEDMDGWSLIEGMVPAGAVRDWGDGLNGLKTYGKMDSASACKRRCEADPVCWGFTWARGGDSQCIGRAAWTTTFSYATFSLNAIAQTNSHVSGYKQYFDEQPDKMVEVKPGPNSLSSFMRLYLNPAALIGLPGIFSTLANQINREIIMRTASFACPCSGGCLYLGKVPTFDMCRSACASRIGAPNSPSPCRAFSWDAADPSPSALTSRDCYIASCDTVSVAPFAQVGKTWMSGFVNTGPRLFGRSWCAKERAEIQCDAGKKIKIETFAYDPVGSEAFRADTCKVPGDRAAATDACTAAFAAANVQSSLQNMFRNPFSTGLAHVTKQLQNQQAPGASERSRDAKDALTQAACDGRQSCSGFALNPSEADFYTQFNCVKSYVLVVAWRCV
ncbi:hypothetical protein DFJ74DRAFT_765769 [Hyaloraphidium curvatum]|nr:hypothetical protein DFJ74DRAFT_765769 [Hyaloraphidium curvatum]